ncbi:hypothetical protein ACFV1W_28770 [Kitasatospora sp. NPDC059648]|uniref:hypothetical protein n=1 Tax=Kitasatospora sp. NPDC059648 TaxID=3346894 RepID=UPI0036B8B86A
MSREGLERLRLLLAQRVGSPCEDGEDAGRVEPLRRQVYHAVTGIDAYLSAVEAGSRTVVGLRERALDLWADLERIATPCPAPDSAVGDADAVRVPLQPVPPV